MGDIRIHMRGNKETGERQVIVEYVSDEDDTLLEHEERHREIVDQLIQNGVISRDEVDELVWQPTNAPVEQTGTRASEGPQA